jgi:hypothetical protein
MTERLLVANNEALLTIYPSGSGWKSQRTHPLGGAYCVAVSPKDPQLVFAGSFGEGLHRSTDGGRCFERLAFGQDSVLSLAVSPADGAVYAGCEPSMLFRSRDGGETWVELEGLRQLPSAPTWSFPPRPWTHHVRQIAPSPHDPTMIVVGIELGGVMRSDDDGATWRDHAPGAIRDCHGLRWHPNEPGRLYEAAGGGSAWSRDGGLTWERIDEGREAAYRHYLTGIAVDPADPDRWYVSASPTPWHRPTADAAIYRWTGSGPWEQLDGGLPQSLDGYPFALAITDNTLYAGLRDGSVWAGRDRAERWERLDVDGGPVGEVCDIAVLAA